MLKLIIQSFQSQYLHKFMSPLVLILYEMSGYVTTFKVKKGNKDIKNKLMSFHIDEDKLLEKYKIIQTKIERLLNSKINVLQIYDNKYIKIVYTKFCGLIVPEDGAEFEPFTIISIDLSLVYKNKYYILLNIRKYIQTNVLKKLWTGKFQLIFMTIFFKLIKISLLILTNRSCKC